MTDKDLEEASVEYENNNPFAGYSGSSDFRAGAQWQRNHVWHDISEKPDMRKFVVFSDGKETMTPPLRNPFDDYPMLIDVANRKYGGGYKVWAYLEDLLPNDKED